jgi:ribosomal protein S4E
VKYYTLCHNEISYVVLYNNYLVKKKEKKDPLFKRFVINVINKDNSITKIENHEMLRDVYYEVNTNEDENNLLLLEIMSKEMIKENSISVKLREGNGIAFVNVDNINGMKLVYLLNNKNEVVSEFTGDENENEVAIDINNKDELNDGNYQLELFAYTNINNNTLIEKYNRVNISVVTEYHKGNKVILIHSQYEFIIKQIISIIIVCICLFILSIISFKFLIFFKSDNTIVI